MNYKIVTEQLRKPVLLEAIEYTVIDNLVRKGVYKVSAKEVVSLIDRINQFWAEEYEGNVIYTVSPAQVVKYLNENFTPIVNKAKNNELFFIPPNNFVDTLTHLEIKTGQEAMWSHFRNTNFNFYKTRKQLQENNAKLVHIPEILKNEMFIKELSRDYIASSCDKTSKEFEWLWQYDKNRFARTNFHNYDFREDLPNKPWKNLITNDYVK